MPFFDCLGCGDHYPASELIMCSLNHRDVITNEPIELGPLCLDCFKAHNYTAHAGETPSWLH